MGEDGAAAIRKGIDLDFASLITDEEPPQVVVVRRRVSVAMEADEDDDYSQGNELRSKSDRELREALQRMKANSSLSSKLKDGGEKLKRLIQRYEVELRRREQLPKDVGDELKKPPESMKETNGVSYDVLHRAPSAPSPVQSSFASSFNKKMEGEMDSSAEKAFDKELFTLNRCSSVPSDKESKSGNRRKKWLSLSEVSHRSPRVQSSNVDDEQRSSGYLKDRKRTRPPHLSRSESFSRSEASLPTRSSSRFNRTKEETVVLLDAEELDAEETTQEDHGEQETLNRDTIIYYPSRNDSGSIEIRYSDMDCLAPQMYVSSTIMNFYIRYLQEKRLPSKSTGEGRLDYHFFNTYFYEKLKEAVAKKTVDENSFAKLRRWWKSVKIFQKAYIFLPIHENFHWSLAIVCMPDKEDHSGLILLHLDSLGIHKSSPIFSNLKSLLKEEWRLIKEGEDAYDVPIADAVWEHLPRRIDGQTIKVPQQLNDYDCGLFTLFFMERFIIDAPERLKKKDVKKFGKHWFNPKEASSLRKQIRRLLDEKFKEEAGKRKQALEVQDSEAPPKPSMSIVIE